MDYPMYLGSDNVKRTANGHYQYLVECSKRWRTLKQYDMEKHVWEMAKRFYKEHKNEIEGLVPLRHD